MQKLVTITKILSGQSSLVITGGQWGWSGARALIPVVFLFRTCWVLFYWRLSALLDSKGNTMDKRGLSVILLGQCLMRQSVSIMMTHRLVWVERDLKALLVLLPCHGQGHLPAQTLHLL